MFPASQIGYLDIKVTEVLNTENLQKLLHMALSRDEKELNAGKESYQSSFERLGV